MSEKMNSRRKALILDGFLSANMPEVTMRSRLRDRGVHEDDINEIITKVQDHHEAKAKRVAEVEAEEKKPLKPFSLTEIYNTDDD